MKKIFLVLVLALTASAAYAWDKRPDEGVVVLASKHLSAEAKALVDKHLGSDYFDDVHYLYTLEQKKTAKQQKRSYSATPNIPFSVMCTHNSLLLLLCGYIFFSYAPGRVSLGRELSATHCCRMGIANFSASIRTKISTKPMIALFR